MLRAHYRLLPLTGGRALSIARDNVLLNPPLREKNCRQGHCHAPPPSPCRDAGGADGPAMVFVDLASGCFFVENDRELRDRLTAFQASTRADAKNPWMLSEYLRCKALYGEDGNGIPPRP